jgi:hypothetical protein
MVPDNPVQDGGRRIARRVRGGRLRHASSSGARRAIAPKRKSGPNRSCASPRPLRMTTAVAPSADRSARKRHRRPMFQRHCAIRGIDAPRNRGYPSRDDGPCPRVMPTSTTKTMFVK